NQGVQAAFACMGVHSRLANSTSDLNCTGNTHCASLATASGLLASICLALIITICASHAVPPADLINTEKAGDAIRVKEPLTKPDQADVRDSRGNTALR